MKAEIGEDPAGQPNRSSEIVPPASEPSPPSSGTEEWNTGRQALGRLVPLSSTPCDASTCGLSTWWSTRALTRFTRWETSSWRRLRA